MKTATILTYYFEEGRMKQGHQYVNVYSTQREALSELRYANKKLQAKALPGRFNGRIETLTTGTTLLRVDYVNEP